MADTYSGQRHPLTNIVAVRTHRNVDLSEKVAHLSRPDAYPDCPDSVQAVETHFAWVFVSKRFVYKLKKPVRAPEFDLTSAQSRRINCELEIALNRRLAPETYLGVVPLGSKKGRLCLELDRHPVDWLVKMRRLPAEVTLERQLPDILADDRRLDQLLETLCDFYDRTAHAPWSETDYVGRLERQCDTAADRLMVPALERQHSLIRSIAGRQRAFVGRKRDLLMKRVRRGRIRDVHGDLRPEHVFLTERPQIIDCLEFSAELRQLDTAEELGFLALECERLGRADIGARLIALYRADSADDVPQDLVDFYLSRRSMLRAHLSIWHLEDWLGEEPARHWTDQAMWYIDRAGQAIHATESVKCERGHYVKPRIAGLACQDYGTESSSRGGSSNDS